MLKEARPGTQNSKNLRAGANEETMEGCLLACSLCLVQPAYSTQDYQPTRDPTTAIWALSHQSLIKKIPYRLAYK